MTGLRGDRWRPWQTQWPWPPTTDLTDLLLHQYNINPTSDLHGIDFAPFCVFQISTQMDLLLHQYNINPTLDLHEIDFAPFCVFQISTQMEFFNHQYNINPALDLREIDFAPFWVFQISTQMDLLIHQLNINIVYACVWLFSAVCICAIWKHTEE